MIKKAIVTGAGGFIGGALTQKLLDLGVKVFGVDTAESKLARFYGCSGFTPVIADFTRYGDLAELIGKQAIDVFYHFAWNGVYGTAFKDYGGQLDNVKYACDAMNQSVSIGCRKFVFAGSMNEYEVMTCLQKDEIEPRYTCIYGSCKLAAEMMLKTIAHNSGIEYCGGLIAMAYGENNYSRMIPNVIMSQLNNGISPRLVEGKNRYDMIYISDIVDAFIAIGEKGKNLKSYYIGHRTSITFRELMIKIRDILSPETELRFGEYPDNADFDYSLIDTEALYNDTGFECTADFERSIRSTAGWLREIGFE